MVMLPQGYCIDSTEVTRAQYQAWLNTNPSLPDSSDVNCGWNTSFAPDASCMNSACQTDCDNHPQVCVDWCDAYAFCQGVGKRLCGKIGGGSNGDNDNANASLSQWYNACVSGGANNVYPYGNTYQPNYCNGSNHAVWTTVPVGSLPNCPSSVPGYQGVYDLSGNVSEWEDSCSGTGQMVTCHLRGGSYYDVEPDYGYYVTCGIDSITARAVANIDVGLRCCS